MATDHDDLICAGKTSSVTRQDCKDMRDSPGYAGKYLLPNRMCCRPRRALLVYPPCSPNEQATVFRSAGLFGCSVLLSGCSATEPSLEELEVEMSNRTAEARRVGVQLEHQSEIIYSTTLRVDGRATVTRATGVTSHPLTVRATVDESFEDVAAYEWHGCTHDVISIYVNPQPEIISGCHDD